MKKCKKVNRAYAGDKDWLNGSLCESWSWLVFSRSWSLQDYGDCLSFFNSPKSHSNYFFNSDSWSNSWFVSCCSNWANP